MAEMIARSPITLPPTASGDGPVLADASLLAKIAIRAPATGAVRDALGVGFGRAARPADGPLAGALVVGSGPRQWTVIGEDVRDAVASVLAATGEFATWVDVSHGRAMLRLTGAAAPALLAKLCAIDLSEKVVPDGAAFRSSVARVVTDVVRDDTDAGRSYVLHCERSSGQYLADAVLDAGREFGKG